MKMLLSSSHDENNLKATFLFQTHRAEQASPRHSLDFIWIKVENVQDGSSTPLCVCVNEPTKLFIHSVAR